MRPEIGETGLDRGRQRQLQLRGAERLVPEATPWLTAESAPDAALHEGRAVLVCRSNWRTGIPDKGGYETVWKANRPGAIA